MNPKTLFVVLIIFTAVITAKAQMVLEYSCLSGDKTITLPLHGTVDVSIDWGDGSVESTTVASNHSHTYVDNGVYTVTISGNLSRFGYYNYPNADKLIKVISWDNIGLTSLSYAFHNAVHLNQIPISLPATVVDLNHMFRSAFSFNYDISTWDVSNVTDMSYMFGFAYSFNQDLSSWDVSNVNDMTSMFYGAYAFNQDISFWDVGNVTSMSNMFGLASAFNQDLSSWDVGNVTDMSIMFYGTSSFNQDLSSWDVSSVNNMSYMFKEAVLFNHDISSWDVSNVTDMSYMFYAASVFDQDLGTWDVSNVLNMEEMFSDVSLSTENYDAILIGWSQLVLQDDVTFHAGNSQYSCVSEFARQFIIETYNWTIYDGGETLECPMALEFNTNLSSGTTITLPLQGIVDVMVDWGDGSTVENITTSGVISYTYALEGTFVVRVTGSATGFGAIYYLSAEKLTKVFSWGDLGLTSLFGAFYNASNLIQVPATVPGSVTDMSYMFYGATSFDGDLSLWDVGNVTDMSNMFSGASSFNQDISSWDTGNITDMSYLFSGATSFNQDLSSWDVSNITDMKYMFSGATSFNQDLSSWDVSNVAFMNDMFKNASLFNQEIGSWNVSNVNNMNGMFSGASSFNQDISLWDVSILTDLTNLFYGAISFNHDLSLWNVSNVTNMTGMFCGAISFNGGISTWDVSNVEYMNDMFKDASAFNQAIGLWNVSSVTSMNSMFRGASSFNHDLNSWDVSNVSYMNAMFRNATSFNHDLSFWDISNVSYMNAMFKDATSFDQDLSTWDVSNVESMYDMFDNVTLSTENYDALLNGWASQALKTSVLFHAGNSQYSCLSAAARQFIVDAFYWTIIDGGFLDDIILPTISCVPNQSVEIEQGETFYTVNGTEFDPLFEDNCVVLNVQNNFNNTSSLANAELPIGVNTIIWNVTDEAGNTAICSNDITVAVVTIIGNVNQGNGISIYPNPVNDFLIIESENAKIGDIEVIDISGKLVMQLIVNNSKLIKDMSDLSNGIYFIKIKNQVFKFLKE